MSDDWRTRKPDIFADADAPAFAKERIRHEIATSRIAGSRLTGSGTSDEDIFAGAGYLDANEYWQVALSEPKKALSFTHLLKLHQLDPSGDPNNLLKLSIESALCFALRMGETWFIRDPHNPERGPGDLNRLMLHPRRAAEWLLSLPKRKHLVPPGLRAFLAPGERHTPCGKVAVITPPPRSRGRKPKVMQRVMCEMRDAIEQRKMPRDELEAMIEKALKFRFSASRDTCRKARDSVLSEIVENSIPDNSSTNDK